MKYLFSLLTLITLHASAQKYTFIKSEAKVKDFAHETFTTSSGKYVDVQHYFPQGPAKYRDGRSTIIAVYDHQLKQLLSKDLDVTEGKWFEGGYTVGDELILFFSDKAKTVYGYKLNVEDGTASLIAELLKPADKDVRLGIGLSRDESHFYLVYRTFNKNERSTYTGIITDRQLKIVNKFSTSDEEADKNIPYVNYAISDEGVFNIITAVSASDSKKDYNPFNYSVTQIDATGKANRGRLTDIPAGFSSSIAWQAVKNDVQFSGLLKIEKDAGFTVMIGGVYDGLQKKVTQLKKTDFDQEISDDAAFRAAYTLKDNSTVIMLEGRKSKSTTYGSVSANGREHTTTTIERFNLYVIKINSNNELAWMKTIYKRQLAIDHDTYTGSVILPDNNDGFHIFFQDCLKNTDLKESDPHRVVVPGNGKKDALAVVYISKDGKMTKKFLEQDKHSDVLFSTVSTVAEGGNRLICTSYQHKNIGRSFYHLAAITVK
jgi:hypothetical protein